MGGYSYGESVHMMAQPEPGFVFLYWKQGNDIISRDAEFDFLLLDHAHLTAVFQPIQCSVEIIYDPEQGSVVNGVSQVCTFGTELTLEAIPSDGYEFDSWRVNHRKYSTDPAITVTIDGDMVIEAVFNKRGEPEVTHAPYIQTEVKLKEVMITAIGDGEVLLYVDGVMVDNPYSVARQIDDVTITISATAKEDGKLISEPTTIEFVVPKLDSDGIDDSYIDEKEVANIRYFNLMGQEMTEVNGATIVVISYKDGSIRVVKVMK
jgi:hypothetical protein